MTMQLQPNSSTTPTSAAAFKMSTHVYNFVTLELQSCDLDAISEQLDSMTLKAPNLFQQTPVIISLDHLASDKSKWLDLSRLRSLLRRFELLLIAFQGGSEFYRHHAMRLSIPWLAAQPKDAAHKEAHKPTQQVTDNANQVTEEPTSELADTTQEDAQAHPQTTFIDHPVRSGQQVFAPGDLVINSSVSSGAELLAVGSIHVYGSLRGRALAGIRGNSEARIHCLNFEAELIAINGQYKIITPSKKDNDLWGKSVIVSLEADNLHINKL